MSTEISTAMDAFAIRILAQWGADADKGAAFTELRRLIIEAERGSPRPLELFCRSGRLKPREIQEEMTAYLRDRLENMRRKGQQLQFNI